MITELIRAFFEGVIARELSKSWHLSPGFRIDHLTFLAHGNVSVRWSCW
jgi:hypothetical protein